MCANFSRQVASSELNVFSSVCCSVQWIYPRHYPFFFMVSCTKIYINLFQCRFRACCQLRQQVNAGLFYLPLIDSCSVWLSPSLCTDMPIFGQCPAQDDFYLVMCSHCSQVVKPQAFQAHYGKCHASAHTQTHICEYAWIHSVVSSFWLLQRTPNKEDKWTLAVQSSRSVKKKK